MLSTNGEITHRLNGSSKVIRKELWQKKEVTFDLNLMPKVHAHTLGPSHIYPNRQDWEFLPIL